MEAEGYLVGYLNVHRDEEKDDEGNLSLCAGISLIDGERGIQRQDIIDFCEHNNVEHELVLTYGDDPCSDHVQYYLYLVPANPTIAIVALKIGFGNIADLVETFDDEDVLAGEMPS